MARPVLWQPLTPTSTTKSSAHVHHRGICHLVFFLHTGNGDFSLTAGLSLPSVKVCGCDTRNTSIQRNARQATCPRFMARKPPPFLVCSELHCKRHRRETLSMPQPRPTPRQPSTLVGIFIPGSAQVPNQQHAHSNAIKQKQRSGLSPEQNFHRT